MNLETVIGLLIVYGYWIVFAAILLDHAGLPIPGELVLVTIGGMARHGHLDPVLGLIVAATAALAGDSLAYAVGRLGGDFVLRRLPPGRDFTPRRRSVVLGKFVIGARLFLAPLAGMTRMPFRRFLLFDGLGVLVWAGLFILLGYALGNQLQDIRGALTAFGAATVIALAIVAIGCIAGRYFRDRIALLLLARRGLRPPSDGRRAPDGALLPAPQHRWRRRSRRSNQRL